MDQPGTDRERVENEAVILRPIKPSKILLPKRATSLEVCSWEKQTCGDHNDEVGF
jgi:hypothetical protein